MLGKNASEKHEVIDKVLGDNAMGRKRTVEWFCRFKHGQTSAEDCECSTEDCEGSARPSAGHT